MEELESELLHQRQEFAKLKNTYSSAYAFRAGKVAGLAKAIKILSTKKKEQRTQ